MYPHSQQSNFLDSIVENVTMLASYGVTGWIKINDNQNGSWAIVGDNQSVTWNNINNTQSISWNLINDSQ